MRGIPFKQSLIVPDLATAFTHDGKKLFRRFLGSDFPVNGNRGRLLGFLRGLRSLLLLVLLVGLAGYVSGGPFLAVLERLVVLVCGGVDTLLFGDVFLACGVEGKLWAIWTERVVEDGDGHRRSRRLLVLLVWVVGHDVSKFDCLMMLQRRGFRNLWRSFRGRTLDRPGSDLLPVHHLSCGNH